MADKLDRFPYRYSKFIDKVNANWDGDPAGDYVMAEHVNSLQDAIVAIEEYLGKNPDYEFNITEIINQLKSMSQLRLPTFHWAKESPGGNLSLKDLNQFNNIILNQLNTQNKDIASKALGNTYGVVDTQLPLATFQTEVAEWKKAGAEGILLLNFGTVRTRAQQNQYLNSVYENELKAIIQTDKEKELISNAIISNYNPNGIPLDLKVGTYVILNDFGYKETYSSIENLYGELMPLIQSFKDKDIKVIGQSNIRTQRDYSYLNALAMLLAIDGIYIGNIGGNQSPVLYDWDTKNINWPTNKLNINLEGTNLVRNVPGGSITISPNGEFLLRGDVISSDNLKYKANTIPGSAIQNNTISADKILSYSAAKIIDAINKSGDSLKIAVSKIAMDESFGLPASIPAENMIANVILAINKAIDPASEETHSIPDALIKQVDANKIRGILAPELFEGSLIPAINKLSNNEDMYLNVPRIDVGNLNLSGTLSGPEASIQARAITADNINATTGITTVDLTSTGHIQGNTGYIKTLEVKDLTAENIGGIKNLEVETLNGKLLNTIALEAVTAKIETGIFNQIVSKALEAENIKTDLLNAIHSFTETLIVNESMIAEGKIIDAHIKNLDAGKIVSGSINTSLVTLSSDDSALTIEDSNIKIYGESAGGTRKLRVLLGNTSQSGIPEIDRQNLGHGLLVLGEDGTTRLYDNTGVYSAGIHNNAVTESKIGESAVTNRVIAAGTITGDKIFAGTITAENIAAGTLTSNEIKGNSIIGASIQSDTIETRHLKVGSVDANKIQANAIEARHIKAGSIQTEHLNIGFDNNLIKQGFDSFEQYEGTIQIRNANDEPINATISTQWARDGEKSIKLNGRESINTFVLKTVGNFIPVKQGKKYVVSAYYKTFAETNLTIQIGLMFNDTPKTKLFGNLENIGGEQDEGRIQGIITVPNGASGASVALKINQQYTEVYFDAIQVEELQEGKTQAGPFRVTATTTISGDSIKTGKINAQRIHLGQGTTFGDGQNVLITDTGIETISNAGKAKLNSQGLTITGGAINITSADTVNRFNLSGNDGILAENGLSKIAINVREGFKITNKRTGQIAASIDNEGNLVIGGNAKFLGADGTPREFRESVAGLIERQRNVLAIWISVKETGNKVYKFAGIDRGDDGRMTPNENTRGKIYDEIKGTTVDTGIQTVSFDGLTLAGTGYIVYDITNKKFGCAYYNKDKSPIVSGTKTIGYQVTREGFKLHSSGNPRHNQYIDMAEEYYIIGEMEG